MPFASGRATGIARVLKHREMLGRITENKTTQTKKEVKAHTTPACAFCFDSAFYGLLFENLNEREAQTLAAKMLPR